VAVKKRYIYLFGGMANDISTNRILRIDTVKNVYTSVELGGEGGWNYGAITLSQKDDSIQILVFGGQNNTWDYLSRSHIFQTSLSDISMSSFSPTSNMLGTDDFFPFNSPYFEGEKIIISGQSA
jgi:hypothetical protein